MQNYAKMTMLVVVLIFPTFVACTVQGLPTTPVDPVGKSSTLPPTPTLPASTGGSSTLPPTSIPAGSSTLPPTITPTQEEAPTPEKAPTQAEMVVPSTTPEDADKRNDSLGDATELAAIREIDVTVIDNPTRQVNVMVSGELPDGCTQIDQITQFMAGHTFDIKITTRRPADAMCAQVLTPFTESFELEVSGLDAGEYTVEVNGASQTFQLPGQASN